MTPGTNYPVQEHSMWFWVTFLTVGVFLTLALMCLFLWEVYRAGQASLPEGVEPPRLPSLKPPEPPAASVPEIRESGTAPAA